MSKEHTLTSASSFHGSGRQRSATTVQRPQSNDIAADTSMEDRLEALRKHMSTSSALMTSGQSKSPAPRRKPRTMEDQKRRNEAARRRREREAQLNRTNSQLSPGHAKPGSVRTLRSSARPRSSYGSPIGNSDPISSSLGAGSSIQDCEKGMNEEGAGGDQKKKKKSDEEPEGPDPSKLSKKELLALEPISREKYMAPTGLVECDSVRSVTNRQEKEYMRMLHAHEATLKALASELEAEEAKLAAEQKCDKRESEAEQKEESKRLLAVQKVEIRQLEQDQAEQARVEERALNASITKSQREMAQQAKASRKSQATKVKESVAQVKRDKSLTSSERKARIKAVKEGAAQASQLMEALRWRFREATMLLEGMFNAQKLEIEQARIQLYHKLLHAAQLVHLGNQYMQQRHWKEMEQATQLMKLQKERLKRRRALLVEHERERSEMERAHVSILQGVEEANLDATLEGLLEKRTREHAAKIREKDREHETMQRSYEKMAKGKLSKDQLKREKEKHLRELQDQRDKAHTRFQRSQTAFREEHIKKAKRAWAEQRRLLKTEQRRRAVAAEKQHSDMVQALKDKASLESTALSAAQQKEGEELQAKHHEIRRQLEEEKVERILLLRRSHHDAISEFVAKQQATTCALLEKQKASLASSSSSSSSSKKGASSSKTREETKTSQETALQLDKVFEKSTQTFVQFANDCASALKKQQELLWVKWEPQTIQSSVRQSDSTPTNAKLSDDTLTAFLSGTMASAATKSGEPQVSSVRATSSSSVGGGKSFEQEYIERISMETGLGEDLVAQVWQKIGGVSEEKILWTETYKSGKRKQK